MKKILNNKRVKIGLISVGGLTLVVGLFFVGYKLGQRQVQSVPTTALTPTFQPEASRPFDETVNWKTYINEQFNYKIKYPDNWILREFPDKTGGGFQPLSIASEIENEIISVDIIERPGFYQDTPFEEYIKVAGIQDIPIFVELNSVESVSSRYGVEGYITTWKTEGMRGQKRISDPIAYLEVVPSRYETIFGRELKYDIIRLDLLREEYLPTFNLMLSTLELLPSEEADLRREYCVKLGIGEKMSLVEARKIAESSECVKEGFLKEEYFCNENTGTWWIDLDLEKEGCNPACVVDVVTKQAEINWRCTGLIP